MMTQLTSSIYSISLRKETRDRERLVLLPAVLVLLLLMGAGNLFAASEGLALKSVDYSALPGNRLRVDMGFSGNAPTPSSFATTSPARIALDFPGVHNALSKKTIPVGVAEVRSIVAVEASDRTRLVVNLASSVPYTVEVHGNRVTLSLNAQGGHSPAPPPSAAAALTSRGSQAPAVENIDFRRGAGGEGRVLITLSSPSTVTNVREQGKHIMVDLFDTQLPEALRRRLDVTDFATPVESITARAKGPNVELNLLASGEYEYIAYQANRLFTIEFRPLTKEEKAALKKKKHVYTGEKLSLNFQNIEVRAVLQLLADFTGLNLVTSDTVTGNVTLRLKNVPWDQAMDIILKTKGLSMRRTDNVIMVAPTEEIAAREKLELESQQQIEELAPLRSEFVQINYAKASDFANLLKSSENRLMSERGQVTVDERTNTLLVQDTAAKLEDIRSLIARLDIPVRQVLIESRIVIANNDFAKDLGVRFGVNGSFGNTGSHEALVAGGRPGNTPGTAEVDTGPFLADVNGQPFNSGIEHPTGSGAEALMVALPAVAPSGALNLLVGKIGSYLLQLELTAMQTEGKGEIVSSPRVITSDKHPATIEQGTEIPYQEASSSGATSVSFKKAVLSLDVTPYITPDDRIRMDLKVNKDNPDFTQAVLGVPPVDTRSVTTSVLVDNGETVVLGGVYERNRSKNKEQVPFFGDLPILGFLFRRTETRDENQELLIFVTPKILKEAVAGR